MSKRARYDGPGSVRVFLGEPGDVFDNNFVDVSNGEWLPTEDKEGNAVRASLRDELLASADWSEVKQATPSKSDKDDG